MRSQFAKLNTGSYHVRGVPALLKESAIRSRLKGLKGWKHQGNFLVRTFEFKHFMDGISFINAVAKLAEEQEHHPDINVRYTTITLSIQTHSKGGVTEWDFELAEAIEARLGRKK
jgi:4a-hydroxytetrahydrobiopterin dehydratase